MDKRIINKKDLLPKMVEGMAEIASVVKRTLGPGGQPIFIQRLGQQANGDDLGPIVTKDGVSVADQCSSPDPEKDLIMQAVKAICRKTNTVAGDGPQPLYAKVLTPTGFKDMSDIRVGMEICGTNGTFQTVLGVFPKGEKEIYEVKFSDGRVIECCADHLWSITTAWGTKKTLTTQSMSSDFKKVDSTGDVRYKYYVPKSTVEFKENYKEMPLDPYLVGLLLGDGSLSGTGSIELSLGKSKEHVINKIKVPEGIKVSYKYVDHKNYFRVKLNGISSDGKTMLDILKSIGLLGTLSGTKFIPKSYLYGSLMTRKSLLQGLLDTDGSINTRGRFEFSTVSEDLYKDFLTLTQSLAIPTHSYLMDRKPGKSYSDTPIYRITELKGDTYGDKIVNITPTGKKTQMQCIKVSNPDSLYFTDNFIATHNTTTAIVLGEAIFKETLAELESDKNLNPQLVRESLELAAKEVLAELTKQAKKVKKTKVITQVATISANGESEIGDIIGQAFEAVGAEGVVTVDEGSQINTTLDIVEGYQFQRGAEGRDMLFNSKDGTQFEAEDARILIYDGKLVSFTTLIPILTKLAETNKNQLPPVVIIANEFSNEVIQWLAIQKMDAGLRIVAVRGPHTTTVRSGYYDDIAVNTGGERLGNGNRSLEAGVPDDFGLVKKVIVDKYTTTFYDGQGDEEAILNRVDQLKAMKEKAESPYDAQVLSDRIAALTQGIAKIGVGGSTDLEIKEKYDRIEDALNASRAAIQDGVIPGGGVTLLKIAVTMEKNTIGKRILSRALQSPFYTILENIGHELTQEEYESIMNNKGYVFDARNKKVLEAFKAGILDPVKVTKAGLENAISISSLLCTAGGGIIYVKDKK